ncbi:hypothetical protein GCM10008957_45260 [Deinococcus ruber]|uniref:Glycosyl transferase family 1 domain-containing protein n=2 Tax=Deinococcus ruber TaxID=1848197 RepID=A0A918FD95_9DEIO|nr:hypothetical protein GCM10008957_45260 [Deinococcus ruber]
MLGFHRSIGSFNLVDSFIALTEFAKQKFIDGGIPARKIITKPNFTTDIGIGSGSGNYAIFVGRLSGEKGLITLLKSWNILKGRIPLKIIGDGPLSTELKNKIPDGIEYLGSMSNSDARELMKEAVMLIYPSEVYETFGLVVIEAMACGTPSIVSSVSVASTIVDHKNSGLVFQSGDSISLAEQVNWALDHPQEWHNIRRQARIEYERKYTPSANLKMLECIYKAADTKHSV